MSDESIKIGDKIHFLQELSDPACEEHPGRLYASKGELGEITEIGGCKEGFWVKTDTNPPFGCERYNFELVNMAKDLFIKELNKFVLHDQSRKCINHISTVKGKSVATNGLVLAWVNQDFGFKHVDEFPAKAAEELISTHDTAQFKPFDMPDLNLEECKSCSGVGYTYKDKCVECDGEGELRLESEYNHYDVDCKNCNGVGSIPSNEESGIAESCMNYGCMNGMMFNDHIEIEGFLINPVYLKLIKHYPNLQIAMIPVDDSKTSKRFYFKSSNQINVIIMGAAK